LTSTNFTKILKKDTTQDSTKVQTPAELNSSMFLEESDSEMQHRNEPTVPKQSQKPTIKPKKDQD
jgi:hypothetical protein